MSRYARQKILPQVGAIGQNRLTAAHLLVVGAGGLGSPVLQYLVGAGVGTITLVDPDVVSLSNLHRQTLFREDQVDVPKVVAAKDTLSKLNSDCTIHARHTPLTPANVAELIAGTDAVLDCADSFAVSYILSDTCRDTVTPLFSASALGFEGYAGGFCGSAPSLRAIFPDLPHRAATCATAGVLGPVVGAIGALQAQMALNYLLQISPSPLGQLITLDMQTFRNGGFRFERAPEPDTALTFIDPSTLTKTDFVVELRDFDETKTPVSATAMRCGVDAFDTPTSTRPTPQKHQRVVLTCRTGLRAWQAARKLQSYWDGDIVLIAIGDPNIPHPQSEKTTKGTTP